MESDFRKRHPLRDRLDDRRDPAGMRDSLDFDSAAIMERRAQDYILDETGYRNAALKDY